MTNDQDKAAAEACNEYLKPENCPREFGWNNKGSFLAGHAAGVAYARKEQASAKRHQELSKVLDDDREPKDAPQSEGREWWIVQDKDGGPKDYVYSGEPFGTHSHTAVHVIEYAAYLKQVERVAFLESENQMMRQKLDACLTNGEANALRAENERLKDVGSNLNEAANQVIELKQRCEGLTETLKYYATPRDYTDGTAATLALKSFSEERKGTE